MLNGADITARQAHSLFLARHQAGLSQESFGARLGVRANQIRRWEHGRTRMRETTFLQIVDLFPYDLSWWYADHSAEIARLNVVDASAMEDVA